MTQATYARGLTEHESVILQAVLPSPSGHGRRGRWPARDILTAILYVLRRGCAWRFLPQHFPTWQTVYDHCRHMRMAGVWEHVNGQLRHHVRVGGGRNAEPGGATVESQSAKTMEQGGPRGYDGGKGLSGRKRHILVDTLGLLLKVVGHPPDLHDRQRGRLLVAGVRGYVRKLQHGWADQGHMGDFKR